MSGSLEAFIGAAGSGMNSPGGTGMNSPNHSASGHQSYGGSNQGQQQHHDGNQQQQHYYGNQQQQKQQNRSAPFRDDGSRGRILRAPGQRNQDVDHRKDFVQPVSASKLFVFDIHSLVFYTFDLRFEKYLFE